jgi:flagellar hook-length control protein FliK
LVGAPQTEKIEEQTAILSQFRTFLSVNKLRAETEVTLRLHPRELGEIKIQITRVENQATHEPSMISAKFQVSSEMVKSVLESNFNMLKDSLQQQGHFNMAQISVDVQTHGSQDRGFSGSMEENAGQRASFLSEENIVANTQAYSPPAHTGDLDRVA